MQKIKFPLSPNITTCDLKFFTQRTVCYESQHKTD
nr:MAG TPA: hypothetical protein [Caudoviricetes sp.]